MWPIFKINTNPEKRYFGFDIIRAFSVILVMNMHFLQHLAGFRDKLFYVAVARSR